MSQSSQDKPERPDLIAKAKLSRLRDRRAQSCLCISGAVFGVAALLGASLYRRWLHPDWTGAQALAALWPVYIAGAISVCTGWYFNTGTSTDGDR
jgi:hypothetical protein